MTRLTKAQREVLKRMAVTGDIIFRSLGNDWFIGPKVPSFRLRHDKIRLGELRELTRLEPIPRVIGVSLVWQKCIVRTRFYRDTSAKYKITPAGRAAAEEEK